MMFGTGLSGSPAAARNVVLWLTILRMEAMASVSPLHAASMKAAYSLSSRSKSWASSAALAGYALHASAGITVSHFPIGTRGCVYSDMEMRIAIGILEHAPGNAIPCADIDEILITVLVKGGPLLIHS
jgi:hypothetical protein